MEPSEFDEIAFFRAVDQRAVRSLLIGRRALVVLGLPVLTADYDLWIHTDDIDALNAVAEPFGLVPTRSPAEARRGGRYVLENGERIDVLVARTIVTVDGQQVAFDDLWQRRRSVELTAGVALCLPEIADLITTKRFSARPRDLEDIRLLEALRREDAS
jgi:hypothetical protein